MKETQSGYPCEQSGIVVHSAENQIQSRIGRGVGISLLGMQLELSLGTPNADGRILGKELADAKSEKLGRVISMEEERALLDECRNSRSRIRQVGVIVALQACLRYSEIRLLRWQQVDLGRRVIIVGKSKTDAGEGRVIPMSRLLHETLSGWAAQFPMRKLNCFVFPQEKYGQGERSMRSTLLAL